MEPDAFTADGQPVFANQYTVAQWNALKAQSLDNPLAFTMPCCHARAILKTSINGLPFFAHYSDQCETAPETIWHLEGKDLIFNALHLFNVSPQSEYPGGTVKDRWKADIYFEVGDRKIAIELQRSYQSLAAFHARQQRYTRHSIECYWLVRYEVGKRH